MTNITPKKSSGQQPSVSNSDIGRLGQLLGSSDHAPVYIAGAIGIISLIGAILVGIWGSGSDKGDLTKGLIGLTIAVVSFLGGYAGKGK